MTHNHPYDLLKTIKLGMKIKISYERFGKIKVKAELSVSMDSVFVAFAANEKY